MLLLCAKRWETVLFSTLFCFNWSVVDLQCCVSFRCIAKWFIYIHWKDWCWSWSSNTLATWCKEPTYWKRPWCWERLRAGREVGDRGWNGCMTSLTQWRWVWANSGRQWRSGRPCVLQSMGSWRIGHDNDWTDWTQNANPSNAKNKQRLLSWEQIWSPSLQ